MFLFQETTAGTGAEVLIIQIFVDFGLLLIFSLLNVAILRFSAMAVVKPLPRFKTAFYISFFSLLLFFIGNYIVSWLSKPQGGSVLQGGSLDAAIESPLIELLPFALFFLSSWIFNSRFLTDGELRVIGLGKGLVVTLIQSISMTAVLLLTILFFP